MTSNVPCPRFHISFGSLKSFQHLLSIQSVANATSFQTKLQFASPNGRSKISISSQEFQSPSFTNPEQNSDETATFPNHGESSIESGGELSNDPVEDPLRDSFQAYVVILLESEEVPCDALTESEVLIGTLLLLSPNRFRNISHDIVLEFITAPRQKSRSRIYTIQNRNHQHSWMQYETKSCSKKISFKNNLLISYCYTHLFFPKSDELIHVIYRIEIITHTHARKHWQRCKFSTSRHEEEDPKKETTK